MKSPEDTAALWYRWMGLSGLILSVLVFLLYAFGLLPTDQPASASPDHWGASAAEYREESGRSYGPGWFLHIGDGAVAAAAALAFLAASALPALIALSAVFFRRGEKLYARLCLAAVLVLASAVAGLP